MVLGPGLDGILCNEAYLLTNGLQGPLSLGVDTEILCPFKLNFQI